MLPRHSGMRRLRLPYAKAQCHAKTKATLCQGTMPCEEVVHSQAVTHAKACAPMGASR